MQDLHSGPRISMCDLLLSSLFFLVLAWVFLQDTGLLAWNWRVAGSTDGKLLEIDVFRSACMCKNCLHCVLYWVCALDITVQNQRMAETEQSLLVLGGELINLSARPFCWAFLIVAASPSATILNTKGNRVSLSKTFIALEVVPIFIIRTDASLSIFHYLIIPNTPFTTRSALWPGLYFPLDLIVFWNICKCLYKTFFAKPLSHSARFES
jgi:hypothetical protein